MKYRKLIIVIISIMFFIVITAVNNYVCITTLSAAAPMYAQIKNSNTYLLKSAESNNTSKWCLLEKSYFVKILKNYNNDYYKVEYNGLVGFVLKNEIMLVNETPTNPYPKVTFSVPNTCYLRKVPKVKDAIDNTIVAIPSNTKDLKYIGKIVGDEAMDFYGNIWYLTEYEDNVGYIYSGYTKNLSKLSENVEQVTFYEGNTLDKINPLSNIECVMIICLTLIPTLIILVILYKPIRSKKLKAVRTPPNVTEMFDENL